MAVNEDDKNENNHFTKQPYWLCVEYCKNQRLFKGLGTFGIAIFFMNFQWDKSKRPVRRIYFFWPLALASVLSIYDYFAFLNCIEECKHL